MKEIIIKSISRPDYNDPKALLKWFCTVFGLEEKASKGSKDIEEQILINFLYAAKEGRGISSTELKIEPKIPRSTLIYHLNRFVDIGIIVRRGHKYYLRANDMSKVIEEINYDIDREFMKMLNVAKEFDRLIDNTLAKTKALLNKNKR